MSKENKDDVIQIRKHGRMIFFPTSFLIYLFLYEESVCDVKIFIDQFMCVCVGETDKSQFEASMMKSNFK